MLDRVICAIYDAADKGVFQAQHKMAEWLGCNIPDLYAVLEAMGHTKISDPIEEKVKAEEEATPVDDQAPPPETAAEDVPAIEGAKPEETKAVPAVKPELATFRLKRNKPVTAREDRPKKPFKKNDDKDKGEKKKFKGKPKDKDRKPRDERERVFSAKAQAKPEDNPFAILQQLKMGNDK